MRKYKAVATFLLATSFIFSSIARPLGAEISEITGSGESYELRIEGTINVKDLEKLGKAIIFFSLFNPHAHLTILVNSHGGSVSDGGAFDQAKILEQLDQPSALGELARLFYSASIEVRSGSDCASACVLLLLAIRDRTVEGEATVGVHRAGYVTEKGEVIENDHTFQVDRRIADFYRKHGMPEDVVQHMLSTPPSGMYDLTLDEMNRSGIKLRKASNP